MAYQNQIAAAVAHEIDRMCSDPSLPDGVAYKCVWDSRGAPGQELFMRHVEAFTTDVKKMREGQRIGRTEFEALFSSLVEDRQRASV